MAFLGRGVLQGETTLGNRLGGDLANSLQGLAKHKTQQLHSQALQKTGLPKNIADIYHTLDPKVQQDIWKQVDLERAYNQQERQQAQQQQLQGQSQPTFTPEQTEYIKSLPDPMQRQQAAQHFQQQNQQASPIAPQVDPNQRIGQVAGQIAQQNPHSIFKQPGVDKYQKTFDYNQQKDINKLERPVVEKAVLEYKEALVNDKILDRQLELVKKGNLPNPILSSAIAKLNDGLFGIKLDLNGILGEDAEEFNKLSAQMVNNLRAAGGRVTDVAMQNFLRSIPTLSQSDEGKERIISNYKIFNDIKKANYHAVRELIQQNGGNIPENLLLQSTDLAEQKVNQMSDRFNLENQQALTSSQYATSKDAIEEARKQGLEEFAIVDESTGKEQIFKRTSSGAYVRSN